MSVLLFSCKSDSDPAGIGDIKNYKLVGSETEETGMRREMYVFSHDNRYSFVRVRWPEGTLFRESFMKDNKMDGLGRSYTVDGKLTFTIEYKNGLKDGRMVSYDTSGNAVKCEIYKKGELTDEPCK